MPNEIRKRGKKHKKPAKESIPTAPPTAIPQTAGPSWIHEAEENIEQLNPEAPFGFVDPELKLYLREMHAKIIDWSLGEMDPSSSEDLMEERKTFLLAIMTEIRGKELQLATDPDCSTILERIAHSMDDFIRRVFMDSLSGSYEVLARHRFGSHVCQTMFMLSAATLERESRGIVATSPNVKEAPQGDGVLRQIDRLVLDASEELLPHSTSLISDPFASHVLRVLLVLLSSRSWTELENLSQEAGALRSARSTAFKSRQGPMVSIFEPPNINKTKHSTAPMPPDFRKKAAQFLHRIREDLGVEDTRALAMDKVASPLLQVLIKTEISLQESSASNSLTNRILPPTQAAPTSKSPVTSREWHLNKLLQDATASHLVEMLLVELSDSAFSNLWETYFNGSLHDLAVHPVANFVVAKAIERLDTSHLERAIEEIGPVLGDLIRGCRTGIIQALIDRVVHLDTSEQALIKWISHAFGLETDEDQKLLVPCCLTLKRLEVYNDIKAKADAGSIPQPGLSHEAQPSMYPNRRKPQKDPLEPTIQGSLILQSLLRLGERQSSWVVDSILSLPEDSILTLCQNPSSSRVLDAVFEVPTIPFKTRRKLTMSFMGHFHTLVDDRIGSRVGERVWEAADPFLKEKIARSIIPHEANLHASHFGRYFLRRLNLALLKRKPDEWRASQVYSSATSVLATSGDATKNRAGTDGNSNSPSHGVGQETVKPASRKRKRKVKEEADEIDTLFASHANTKKPPLTTSDTTLSQSTSTASIEKKRKGHQGDIKDLSIKERGGNKRDEGIGMILDAIRVAPR